MTNIEWWIEDHLIHIMLGLLAAIIGIVLTLTFLVWMPQQAAWEDWCRGEGGHVDSHTDYHVGTGVGSNGSVVTTTSASTTHFCLTEDGRILDIR